MKSITLARRMGAGLGLLTLAGCTTLTPDPVPVYQGAGVDSDVKALQEWRREARQEQESQAAEIEKLRKQLNALEAAFREQQQATRVQFQDLETSREQDKKYITDELTRRLTGLVGSMAPPAPAATPKSGYEHVVKPRETLSDIAKAYKVSLDSILKANNLKNGNTLKVGQKLFIPD